MKAVMARVRAALPGISQIQIGKATGIAPTTVAGYFQARYAPSLEFLYRLALAFDLNLNWLLTGGGPKSLAAAQRAIATVPMEPGPSRESAQRIGRPEMAPTVGQYGRAEPVDEESAAAYQIAGVYEPGQSVIDREAFEHLAPADRRFYVPIVAVVQCGLAVENAPDQVVGWADSFVRLPEPARDPNAFAVKLAGESMEPTFRDGDLILAGPNRVPVEGEPAVVVFHDSSATFKCWRQDRRSLALELWAINPAWPRRQVDMRSVRRIVPLLVHMPLMLWKKPG